MELQTVSNVSRKETKGNQKKLAQLDIRLIGGVAGQVVEGSRGQRVTKDTEARVGCVGSGVLKSVPPHVGLPKQWAADLIPVCLGVFGRSDSLAGGLTADGVASFGNPDGLSASSGLGGVERIEEETLVVLDGVGHGVLEVGVGINANPVAGINHSLVGAVDPDGPGVNMTNGGALETSAGNGFADLLDVVGNSGGLSAGVLFVKDAGRRDTVEILATDGDAGDEASKVTSILVNGRLQGLQLIGEDSFTRRSPEAKQQTCLGLDSSRDGRDWGVGSSPLLSTGCR